MLAEQFIASVGVPTKALGTNITKDAAISIYQFQPLLSQEQVFKKSATLPNCLAVSSTHVFAAQAERAVVHVYSREKGNQEAIVPFTERITCIQLACNETVLALGTAEGRLFLWEIASGRQISTSQAHLQAVTTLALDGTGNFLLSASRDSTVHVWSLTNLLSFANAGLQAPSPISSFTSHRAEVIALVLGRSAGSANIAVSASSDKTCLIWDYHTNSVLRTYLLSATPTCLAIDAAERAVYVGYDDGSIQQLDLYASGFGLSSIRDPSKQALAPVQPPGSSKWQPVDKAAGETAGAVLSISVSFDSCTILTGHESGAILSWDAGKNGMSKHLLQNPLPGPVTALNFLHVTGFVDVQQRNLQVPSIVKPKFGAFDSSNGTVPSNYVVNVKLSSDLSKRETTKFDGALTAPSFSTDVLDEGLNELMNWGKGGQTANIAEQEESEDFMALDQPSGPRTLSLEEQNAALKAELDALRRLQKASFDRIEKMGLEKKALLQREEKRLGRSNHSRTNGAVNGNISMDDSTSDDD